MGKFLLIARLRPGLVTCYDVTSGTEVWTERMEGGFSSSPIVAAGLVWRQVVRQRFGAQAQVTESEIDSALSPSSQRA